MKFTGALDGVKAAERAMRKVEPTVREHVGIASDLTGKDLARHAAAGVPVRYGFLRQFIVTKHSRPTGFVTVGTRGGTMPIPNAPGGGTAIPARYAHLVHFGTSRTRGVPFMMNAARGQQRPYADRTKRAVLDA